MAGGGQSQQKMTPQMAAMLRGMAGSAGPQAMQAMQGQAGQGLMGQQPQPGAQAGMGQAQPPGGPQIPQWAQGLLNGGLSGQ